MSERLGFFARLRLIAATGVPVLRPSERMARTFGDPEAALRWAYEILSVPGNYACVKLGVRKAHRGIDDPTAEEVRDLAHTITATLYQAVRPQAALILSVLCGWAGGGRWDDAVALIAGGVRLTRPIPPAALRALAEVALARAHARVCELDVPPQTRYAKALGVRRESVFSKRASPKWREAIDALEERVRTLRDQGVRDLDVALRAKGIIG